jgi:hypothetical protein
MRGRGFKVLTSSDRKAYVELIQYEIHVENERFLVELANLHDSGYPRFLRQWGYATYQEDSVMKLRDYVRAIWEREFDTEDVNRRLAEWLHDTGNLYPSLQFALYPDVESGELIPNSGNLAGRLALAILTRYQRMRVCSNPHCAVPFFLARRSTQRFCERGECTRYAQNQYALKWWRERHESRTVKMGGGTKRGTRKTR